MLPQPKPRPVADSEQLAALRRELARLTGEDPETLRFGVAVSGGSDSMALLLLMHQAAPGRVAAATVDHGLRAESAAEAEAVSRICAELGMAHSILRATAPIRGSVQAAARTARYALLEEWRAAQQIDYILTAHHADDQAETLLMRLNRASGVAGLAAIRDRNGRILRPVLGWRRAALRAVVDAAGITAADDPSNRDPRFDRARMRAALADAPWLDVAAAARSAALLAEADVALDWAADQIIAAWPDADDPRVIRGGLWPDEIGWRILRRRLIEFFGQCQADQSQLLRGLGNLRDGRKVSLGAVVIVPDRHDYALWHMELAPPRRR